MGQNRSSAVMQQRKVAPDSLDYFPTPPWATRALCEWLNKHEYLNQQSCWEPACGEMHMVKPLKEYFGSVRASDVHNYHTGHDVLDFSIVGRFEEPVDWVITNPPFRIAQQFIETALQVARIGTAMLVRSAFMEGQDRHRDLFGHTPPSFVLQFVERVGMFEGRLIRMGDPDPFNLDEEGNARSASSATAYCWMIWLTQDGDNADTRLRWIEKCRKQLERPTDFPKYEAVA